MKMTPETLNNYRDVLSNLAHANNKTLLLEDRMDDAQRAGTALLLATISVSFAAGLIAKTDPRLINAPFEVKIDDCLNLLRDVLAERKTPDLTVV